MVVAIVVPFALTFIVGSRKLSVEDRGLDHETIAAPADDTHAAAADETDTDVKAILSGKVIPLDDVPDDVFSQHIMGDGVAIEPTDNVVVAPANADVGVVMADSGHACGLVLDNGMELLIHVGIDTVDMNGDGFNLMIKEGERVRKGQPLIKFDPEKIKKAGHPTTTMLIVTGEGEAKNLQYHTGMDAKAGETPVITFEK